MKLPTALLTLTLLATAVTAAASGPSTTGAPATPANRIVGVWSNISQVGPCGGAPNQQGRQTLMFHAGGTFLDNSRFPPQGITTPGGVVQRSVGLGTWSYDPAGRQYSLRQQFDLYLNNVYDGYQVIERTMLLSHDGNEISGPVLATRHNADGSPRLPLLCGEALSTRL